MRYGTLLGSMDVGRHVVLYAAYIHVGRYVRYVHTHTVEVCR